MYQSQKCSFFCYDLAEKAGKRLTIFYTMNEIGGFLDDALLYYGHAWEEQQLKSAEHWRWVVIMMVLLQKWNFDNEERTGTRRRVWHSCLVYC